MTEREELLTALAKKYQTDKLEHGYIPYYAQYLPAQVVSMLEIGVWHGASARMFDDFFQKRTDIHLLDLFMEPGNMTPRMARDLGFVPYAGSQSDISFISTIKEQFDFIEEDGSHNSYDQIASFKHFFLNNLRSNGLWATEDLHCCNDPFYWGNLREFEGTKDTILGMAKHFMTTGKIVNPFFNEGESRVFENIILRMKLVADQKLLLVWKK